MNQLQSAATLQSAPPAPAHCPVEDRPTAHALLYEKWGYPIVRCQECGLVGTAIESSESTALARIYDREYFEGGRVDGYGAYGESEAVLRRQFRRTLRKARSFKPQGTLLDIGCAYGYLLAEATGIYSPCIGTDVSEHCVSVARQNGLDARCGLLEAQGFADESFDVVTLMDCIEHVPQPRQLLQHVHSLLRPEGVVAISTGDMSGLYPRLVGKNWRLMTPPQHLWFFTRQTLVALLQSLGFSLLQVTYDWKYIPLGLAAYQAMSRLHLPARWTRHLPGGIYVNLFDAMTVWARKSANEAAS